MMPKQLCHPPELLQGPSLLGTSSGASEYVSTVELMDVAQQHLDDKSG